MYTIQCLGPEIIHNAAPTWWVEYSAISNNKYAICMQMIVAKRWNKITTQIKHWQNMNLTSNKFIPVQCLLVKNTVVNILTFIIQTVLVQQQTSNSWQSRMSVYLYHNMWPHPQQLLKPYTIDYTYMYVFTVFAPASKASSDIQ